VVQNQVDRFEGLHDGGGGAEGWGGTGAGAGTGDDGCKCGWPYTKLRVLWFSIFSALTSAVQICWWWSWRCKSWLGLFRGYAERKEAVLCCAVLCCAVQGRRWQTYHHRTNRIQFCSVLCGMQNRTCCPYLTAIHRILIPVGCLDSFSTSSFLDEDASAQGLLKPTGYSRSYFACRIGQPSIPLYGGIRQHVLWTFLYIYLSVYI
jgi:hypothetical protein